MQLLFSDIGEMKVQDHDPLQREKIMGFLQLPWFFCVEKTAKPCMR